MRAVWKVRGLAAVCLLCRGKHNSITTAHCRQSANFSNGPRRVCYVVSNDHSLWRKPTFYSSHTDYGDGIFTAQKSPVLHYLHTIERTDAKKYTEVM
jgi:hypothetical protein